MHESHFTPVFMSLFSPFSVTCQPETTIYGCVYKDYMNYCHRNQFMVTKKNCHESLFVIKKGVGAWKAQKNKKSHQQMHTVCDFITKSIFVFIHTSQSSLSSATVSLIHTNPLPNANSKHFTQKK